MKPRPAVQPHEGATLLVDDHPLFRLGFASAWRRTRPHDRLLEAANLATARDLIERPLRLVVLDVLLPDGVGFDLAPELVHRGVPFVILSTADAPAILAAARRCGASAFFPKEWDPDHILVEIDRVLRDPSARVFPPRAAIPGLRPRERDVLLGLLAGLGNREIASRLGVGIETVKTHVASVLAAFGATDRIEAVRIAREFGFDLALPYLGEEVTLEHP